MRLNVVACSIMNPCAAPLITASSAPGIRSANSSESPRGREDVLVADDHERGRVDVAELVGDLVVGAQDRANLTRERVRRARERQRTHPADHRRETTERSRADDPSGGLGGHRGDAAFARDPRPLGEQLATPWMMCARGARQRQGSDALGMADREDLGDRTAHRRSGDMCVVDTGAVEHRDRVVGHLFERVLAEGLVAATRATIVERDRPVPGGQGDALEVPAVLVGTEALDQEHGWAARTAGLAVVQADAVGGSHVGHQTPPSPPVSQSSGVPVSVPPKLVEDLVDPLAHEVGELELSERSAPPPRQPSGGSDLDAGVAPAGHRRGRRGQHANTGGDRGADESVVDRSAALIGDRTAGAEHDDLAGPQRTLDLVFDRQ